MGSGTASNTLAVEISCKVQTVIAAKKTMAIGKPTWMPLNRRADPRRGAGGSPAMVVRGPDPGAAEKKGWDSFIKHSTPVE